MASTQDALYRRIDLDLSWSERDLPERERTKHVHRLHPYLGKFIPQLVEALLARHLPSGGRVLDPFAGSGTTLVQALESGFDAAGSDVAPFNCLLMRVKTREYNPFVLESDLRDALGRLDAFEGARAESPVSRYVRDWYAPRSAAELLFFRGLVEEYEHADVLRVVLARAARSARRTTHFDLDFPRRHSAPSTGATSTGRRAAPSARRAGSCAGTRSTRWRESGSSRASAYVSARQRCCTGTRASWSSGRASTESSPLRRTPA